MRSGQNHRQESCRTEISIARAETIVKLESVNGKTRPVLRFSSDAAVGIVITGALCYNRTITCREGLAMAAGENQKLKLLYLQKILMEETDPDHGLSAQEIIEKLEAYGVNADRKTLYGDFSELERFGLDIVSEHTGRNVFYHLNERTFELPELKLLVDSVQASKFITERKSRQLIRKLESLVSNYEAKHLHRQVLISGRVKTMNESIYYNVDMLHEAINLGKQIRFHYGQWNVHKKMVLRRGGAWYQVSPWCLMWDDENYYLVAYDSVDGIIRHYRVDKMLHLSISTLPREGKEAFREFDAAKYTRQLFGMFGGEVMRVTLEARNEMAGVLIDRFGSGISITPTDEEHFTASMDVAFSPHFLGWIVALGEGIKITGPEKLVEQMKAEAKRLSAVYL